MWSTSYSLARRDGVVVEALRALLHPLSAETPAVRLVPELPRTVRAAPLALLRLLAPALAKVVVVVLM